MCITEEKLVEAYGNSNPHERFLLIYKNYSVYLTATDGSHKLLKIRDLSDVGRLIYKSPHMYRKSPTVHIICFFA